MKLQTGSIPLPVITKTVGGKDVSSRGAFPSGERVTFTVRVSRKLGASGVVLRINRDGESDRDIALDFSFTELGWDVYNCEIETQEGLYYYEFLFIRGGDTLFTDSINNVDYQLSSKSGVRFRLLVYQSDFETPEWMRGATMYHIFVDRFCRGKGKVSKPRDAILDEDWENGIPQYPEKNGDRYSNNVFFGGNLWGVIEKLDHLCSLGVTVIYLSPIFKAYSNHKYDTGDYLEIDAMFGGEKAFLKLISEAKKRGIRIILDGVFNHTGDDSRYFDKYGKYGKTGAYTNPDSPYIDWYKFKKYPEEYKSWWGIDILPQLNHENKTCRDFFVGEGGVISKYTELGIGGWRLDVADELPNEFLDSLRVVAKEKNPEALIIGEVWENAADKISYGLRRRYFGGKQLDSVMNYPLKSAIVDFIKYRDASILADTLVELYSSYPPCVCDCLMNILGTHDTERILTVLGVIEDSSLSADGAENSELAVRRMNKKQRAAAIKLLKMAAVIQYTVFGVPSIYYGDETGMEGYHDPFCRMPYPWGREDAELVEFYRTLGRIRQEEAVLKGGEFKLLRAEDGCIVYAREKEDNSLIIAINRSDDSVLVCEDGRYTDLLTGKRFGGVISKNRAVILKKK